MPGAKYSLSERPLLLSQQPQLQTCSMPHRHNIVLIKMNTGKNVGQLATMRFKWRQSILLLAVILVCISEITGKLLFFKLKM